MASAVRSMRRRIESKSGARSSSITVPKVEERWGSFSSRHISPSASLIERSKYISGMPARLGRQRANVGRRSHGGECVERHRAEELDHVGRRQAAAERGRVDETEGGVYEVAEVDRDEGAVVNGELGVESHEPLEHVVAAERNHRAPPFEEVLTD